MAETREQKLAREMSHAYSGPQPVDIVTPISRGLRRWVPDIAALPGDIADAVIYGARRAVTGNRNTPSAGLGAASRQWAKNKIERTSPRQQTEMSAPDVYSNPQQTALEEMVAMANPAMWNPRLLLKPEVAGGLAAAFGGTPGMLGVVKPKGGTWLSGSVENALRGLKRMNFDRTPMGSQRLEPLPEHLIRREGWDPADIETHVFPDTGEMITADQAANELRGAAINQWIEGPLTKYVKSRMASPEDEVRRLAEQGVLHFEPPIRGNTIAATNRRLAGYPMLSDAKTEQARRWEDLVDAIPNEASYLDHVPVIGTRPPPEVRGELHRLGGQFAVDNPLEKAYGWNRGFTNQDVGFNHLIDELSNALNPASGLPRNLQLSPEAVKQLSMEKAVRRVAEINAWRAAQKVEANRKLAEQASLVREYPHSEAMPNPKGLRWVELKPRDLDISKLPEGYVLREINPTGRGSFWAGERTDVPGLYYGHGKTPEEGLSSFWKAYPATKEREALQQDFADQLKYEGDVMGNCVGGYCDDVLSGRSRIFSLRDVKGEPHVTVEVRPAMGEPGRRMGSADLQKLLQENPRLEDEYYEFLEKNPGYEGQLEDWFLSNKQKPADRIVQIKGKQNRAPNEEYLPFVQDFVRNSPLGSPWSDVGDLGNTGLWSLRQAETHPTWTNVLHGDVPTHMVAQRTGVGNQFENPDAVLKALREAYPDADYLTADEYRKVFGFAQGGRVDSSGTETLGTRDYSEDAPEATWPFAQGGRVEAPAAAWPF